MENKQVDQVSDQVVSVQQDTAIIADSPAETLGNSPPSANYTLRNEGDSNFVVKQLTERYHLLENITWSTTYNSGFLISGKEYPQFFFKKGNKIPNLRILNNYAYWNCDFGFEIEITAPKMSYGVLCVSWCYDYSNMSPAEKSIRKTLSSICSMDHHLIHAETNAKIRFDIPFKSYKPYGIMTEDKAENLYALFKLFIMVLTPLKMNLSIASSVDVQVRCCLKNLKVSGLRMAPESGMMNLLLKAGERLLDTYFPDPNRDLPTDIREVNQVIIRNSQQLCVGKGVRAITMPLRLDVTKTTPYSNIVNDELKISFLLDKWGYLTTFSWDTTHVSGTLLYQFDVQPIQWVEEKKNDGLANYYEMPPLSVIASTFLYWRGSIDIKIVCAANSFVAGKLVVAFIPNGTPPFNLDKLSSSYYTTYEIGAEVEFVFSTPFIFDKQYALTSSFDGRMLGQSIGKVVFMTYSQLGFPMTEVGIAKAIDFCIFVRGGRDFELAVPRQPIIGLGLNRLVNKNDSFIKAKPGYSPVYVDNWRSFESGTLAILRYGSGTDHIAQFVNINKNSVYKCKNKILTFTSSNAVVYAEYLGVPIINDGYDDYLAPINSLLVNSYLKRRSNQCFYNLTTASSDYVSVEDLRIVWYAECERSKKNVTTQMGTVSLGCEVNLLNKKHYGEEFLDLKDIFRRFNVYGDSYKLIPKDFSIGKVIFRVPVRPFPLSLGIQDNGALTAYRRITREGPIAVMSSCFRFFRGSLRFKLIFSNCNLTIAVFHDPIDTGIGEDVDQPRILSSETMVNQGLAGVVQNLNSNNIIDLEVPFYNQNDYIINGTIDDIKYKLDRKINTLGSIKIVSMCALKIETPISVNIYYALGDDARFHTYNGYYGFVNLFDISQKNKDRLDSRCIAFKKAINAKEMVAYLHREKENKESSFSEISDNEIEPQMIRRALGVSDDTVENSRNVVNQATEILNSVNNVTNEIKDSKIVNKMENAILDVNNTICKANEVANNVNNIVNDVNKKNVVNNFSNVLEGLGKQFSELKEHNIVNKMSSLLDTVMEQLSNIGNTACEYFDNVKDKLYNLFFSVLHVIINPTLPTFCVTVAQILCNLKLFSSKYLAKISKVLSGFLSKFNLRKVFKNQEGSSNELPKNASPQFGIFDMFDENDTSAGLSMCLSMMANSMKIYTNIKRCPSKYFMSELSKDLKTTAHTSNILFVFFRNTLGMFIKMYRYLVCFKLNDTERCLSAICDEDKTLMKWFNRSAELTNPLFKNQLRKSSALIVESFILRTMGERYLSQFLVSNSAFRGQMQVIRDMVSSLKTITNELTTEHLAPQVRFEPYCFQLVGGTKVGKSFVSRKVILNFLKEVNIKTSDPIFTRNPGPEYLNGIDCQPCFYVDDFLQILGNGCAEEAIAELFCLKSSATFNPNIAQLEKKNLRYNPALVFLCSNRPFYDGMGINMLEIQALHRRRDAMWEMKIKSEFLNEKGVFVPQNIDRKTLDSFDHVLFRKYNNVESFNEPLESPWLDFASFLKESTADFKKYYLFEMENYRRRLQECSELLPEMNTGFEIEDLIREFNVVAEDFDKKQTEKICKYLSCNGKVYNYVNILKNKMASNVVCNDAVNLNKDQNTIVEELMGATGLLTSALDSAIGPQMGKRPKNKDESSGETTPLLQEVVLDNDSQLKEEKKKFPKWYSYELILLRSKLCEKINYDEGVKPDLKAENFELVRNCPHRHLIGEHGMKYAYYDLKDKLLKSQDNDRNDISMSLELCDTKENCVWNYKGYKKSFCDRKCAYYIDSMCDLEVYDEWIPELKKKILDLFDECGYEAPYNINMIRVNQLCETEKRETKLQKCRNILGSTTSFIKDWAVVLKNYSLGFISRWWKWALLGFSIWGLLEMGARSAERTNGYSNGTTTTTVDPYVPVSAQTIYDGGARMNAGKAKLLSSAKMRGFVAQPQTVRNIRPQMATKSDGIRLILRNSGYIYYTNLEGKVTYANFLGICGHNVLIPGHMLEEMCKVYDVNIDFHFVINVYKSGDVVLNFSDCKFSYDSSQNSLAILILPNSIPSFRNIRSHIATAKEHSIIAPNDCTILRSLNGITTEIPVSVKINSDIVVNATDVSKEFILPACYQYNVAGEGMCGSVLFRNLPSFKIIGVHIAGNKSKTGFAEPIFFEQFEEYTNGVKIAEPEFGVVDQTPMVQMDGVFLDVGLIPRDKVVRISPKSQYEKTPMHGEIRPVMRWPAILSKSDPRAKDFEKSPISYGVSKHGNPPIPFKSEVLENAKSDLSEKIIAVCRPVLCGPDIKSELSDQQVFGGIPGMDCCKRLELHTSEGYPLQLERPKGCSNKSWLFKFSTSEKGNILHEKHELLEELHNFNMDIRNKGDIPMTIFTDSLKDELVKENKLKPGGTRVFSVSPLEFTWTIKKYFGWFQAAFINSRINSETAIGINPDSSEWATLFKFINEVENKDEESNNLYLTGDYSAFGDCLQSQCIIAAFEIMIDWYVYHFKIDKQGVAIRRLLCLELLNAIHLAQNVMYKTFCGIPSGFALTVEINSLVNCLYMRNAWQEITKRPLAEFGRDVRLVTYGDDLLMKVAKDIGEKYNFNTIQQYLTSYNIAFTPASKDVNDKRKFLPLQEVNFLKRTFERHPTRRYEMLGPLPESSITEMLNWSKKNLSKTPEDRLMENCRGALLNAYGKGPFYYNQLRKSLIDWWSQRGIHFRCETWVERDRIIFE